MVKTKSKEKGGKREKKIKRDNKIIEPTTEESPIVEEPKQTKQEKKKEKMVEKLKEPKEVGKKEKSKLESSRSKRFRKIEKITAEHRLERGVIYLGHIPYGFREEEMKEFFTQFGEVTRIKLARSKRSGRPKGYAFIEFNKLETAEVAAETMNNRFMLDRQLVSHVVDDEKLHKDLFKN
jgi:nucleolar protein 15